MVGRLHRNPLTNQDCSVGGDTKNQKTKTSKNKYIIISYLAKDENSFRNF